MPYETGDDWRIQIGDGVTPTEGFDLIGGEMSFDWQRSSTQIEYSTKDDAEYANQGFGRQAITFNISGKTKLPDKGLERAFSVSKTGERTTNIQVMKGVIVKYSGLVAIGNFSGQFPDNAPVTYSFAMSNRGAPTVDNLGRDRVSEAPTTPANEDRGELDLELGGRTFRLRPSFTAIRQIEKACGEGVYALFRRGNALSLDLDELGKIAGPLVRAGADADDLGAAKATDDRLAEMIHEQGSTKVQVRLTIVLLAAATGGYTGSGEAKAAVATDPIGSITAA